jgi:ankyrin repeat protein
MTLLKKPEHLDALLKISPDLLSFFDSLSNLPIHYVATNGHPDILTKMVKLKPALLESKNKMGHTPLVIAALNRNQSTLKALLSLGANPNVQLPNGMTALTIALQYGAGDLAKDLLSNPLTDVNLSMPSGETYLHLAINMGLIDICQLIIPKMTDFKKATKSRGYTVLHQAADIGLDRVVELIMKTAKIEVDHKSGSGSTALHLAAANNHLKTVEILVTYKANIQLVNSLGDTPLMRALECRSEAVAMFLAERQPLVKTSKGTYCKIAAEHNMWAVVDLLIERGDDANHSIDGSPSCVDYIVRDGSLSRINKLHEKKKIDLSNKTLVKRLANLSAMQSFG